MEKQTPAEQTRSTGHEVEIDAPVDAVWRALTDGSELERWFPLEARVEPGEGGKIWMSWKNEYAGESRILRWEPNRHLRTSWGFSGEPGSPAQITDYYLEARGGKTLLRVVTSGFPTAPDWDDWVEGTRRGWQFELQGLKHYLEKHRGVEREVVYLRRRVSMACGDAWALLLSADGLGRRPFSARPFIDDAPHQYAAVVDDLNGAVLRISMDPCMGEKGYRDVTLWLSTYGLGEDRMRQIRDQWSDLLSRLYPEGKTI
jgi:uncharacterized protein YndB with AHSA1/START domain